MFDWSATAAWIALIVAIISPFLTAVLNNNNQMKLKKIEMYTERQLMAYTNYLRAAKNIIFSLSNETESMYGKESGNVQLF